MNRLLSSSIGARLFLIFNLIFILALSVLSTYLLIATTSIDLSTQAKNTTEYARPIFQLKKTLSRLELAHNQYEITADLGDLTSFSAFEEQLYGQLDDLYVHELETQDETDLLSFDEQLVAYSEKFSEITASVEASDWDQVAALDEEAYQIIPGLFKALDILIQRQAAELTWVIERIELFQTLAYSGIVIGIGLFLALALVALWLIHRQLNVPLHTLSQAVIELEQGRFTPAPIEKLSVRSDEIGAIARELLDTAASLAKRRAELEKLGASIQAKIR